MGPVSAEAIRAGLASDTCDRLESLELFPRIDSTNSYLLSAPTPGGERLRVAIAGEQAAGRGRLGRRWVSAPGAGLWMSVAAGFEKLPPNAPAVTLAVGAAVARALQSLGVRDVGLKWPNDLLVDGAKLGGILVESAVRADGTRLVCGLGINTRLPGNTGAADDDFRPAALAQLLDGAPEPAELAAPMIEAVREAFDAARAGRLDALLALWRGFDRLRGREVSVDEAGRVLTGIASGIDDDGALLLRSGEKVRRVVSGTLRLRPPVGMVG